MTAASFDVANTCESPPDSCLGPNGGSITVSLSNGFMQTFAGSGVSNFFGFTTDMPVTSITVSTSGHPSGRNYTELTNFRSGAAAVASVPEPSTLLLLGTGLIAVGYRRRRMA